MQTGEMNKPLQTISIIEGGKEIKTEIRRTYTWGDGSKVTIEEPVTLIVSEHGHRIADANGNGHYVPMGWIHLYWVNKPGSPPIVC